MGSRGTTDRFDSNPAKIIDNGDYVYNIKKKYMQTVYDILDMNKKWIDAAEIMGYSKQDVMRFTTISRENGESATEILISNWGDQNHTVTELFMVLYRLKQYWAMDCLRTEVDLKYHYLIEPFIPEVLPVADSDPFNQLTSVHLPTILYKELSMATNDWNEKNILGKGGFGIVYKGRWKNTDVAIKRFECKVARDQENKFEIEMKQTLNELKILISCRHDNILPLYARSTDDKPCVIFQLLVGGSLDGRIHKGTPLTLQERVSIAIGTARGIQFLHKFDKKPLIHCDIKPANILLDANLVPKIGDFGLVREGSIDATEVSKACGTKPYLPDEFLLNRKLSIKVDTFSYGVVLFEMFTGLAAFDRKRMGNTAFLSNYMRSICRNCQPEQILHLMDDKLPTTNIAQQVFFKFIQLGLRCVSVEMESRPEMFQVFEELEDYAEKNQLLKLETRKNGIDVPLPKIPYKELEEATDRWDDRQIFGKGIFGELFRGRWKYTDVAIKRINFRGVQIDEQIFKNEMNQSMNELRFLASCRHDNILLLYGYSDDGTEPCLVYQYMPGGSLQWRLNSANNQILSFEKRKEIAIGTARGLQFLHTFKMGKPLIHGDIKPGNIFLDANCVPKIGDFSLVREGSHEAMKISKVYGERPYLPDEFLCNNILSTKVDTFSYGVVLLEMMTGMEAFDSNRSQNDAFLSTFMWSKCFKQPKECAKRFIDPKMQMTENEKEMYIIFVNLGLCCTIQDVTKRPEMVQVLKAIEDHIVNAK